MTTGRDPAGMRPRDAGTRGGLWRAIDERLGLSELTYPVPRHANSLAYSLGGISLIGFAVLIISGVVLAQYYPPVPEFANDSVRAMMRGISVARIVRGVHYWAAQIVLLTVLLHMLRIFFTGAFKMPREANWIVGVGLLALTIGLFFTGTVLKWDQEGFEALEHNTAIGELLGGLGHWFAHAFAENVPLLVRLYIAHVSILPGLLLLLLGAHFWLIKTHGISPRPGGSPAGVLPFASHLTHLGKYALVFVGVVLALAVLLPPTVGPAPVEGIEVTKPPWIFLPLFAFENWIGIPGLLWATVVFFTLLVCVPLLDRSPEVHARRRPAATAVAVVVMIGLAALGILAWVTTGAQHVGGGM